MNNLRQLIKKINIDGRICFREPMHCHTSFQIGGPADIFVEPDNREELVVVYQFCLQNRIPCFILGQGANILVADTGIRGMVISTKKLSRIDIWEDRISAEAGAAVSKVAEQAGLAGWSGLEFIYAMPGSVGGSIYMNARCYNVSISDVLESVEFINLKGETTKLAVCKEDFGYKTSPFQKNKSMILKGCFRLNPGPREQIREKMDYYKKDRTAKGHFLFPCAGSVFKNNRSFGKPTGAIIDSLGLKGYSIGGARISEAHANIIVNTGSASARDVYRLMQETRDRVKAVCGFQLEPEIILVGDWEENHE